MVKQEFSQSPPRDSLQNSTLNAGFHFRRKKPWIDSFNNKRTFSSFLLVISPKQCLLKTCKTPALLKITDLICHHTLASIRDSPLWLQRYLGFYKLFILYTLPYLILIAEKDPSFLLLYELFYIANFLYISCILIN